MSQLDYYNDAVELQVIDVWQPGNITGWVTPRVLYDASLGHVYSMLQVLYWMLHGTVGLNTLRFWCTGESIASGEYTMAQWLIPHDTTQFADGRMHDTSKMVFKMAPDGRSCNHTGFCIPPITNRNTIGMEYESWQNGSDDISRNMYVKGALVYTNAEASKATLTDAGVISHGLVANNPVGRRSDPYAGPFDYAYHFSIVQDIRRDPRIWARWGLPQPKIRG